jgi:lipid-A-disaccharide synthase
VVLYKTSWITYLLGRWFVKVAHIAMPNVLAGREVFPEFIQRRANAENLARETRHFLEVCERRIQLRSELDDIARSLGGKGAAGRAAKAIARLTV